MKITRKILRELIIESMKGFKDPTDDPRFSDPSYSGGPGSYYQSYDFDGKKQIGISIEFPFYDSSHPMYEGDIEFYNHGVDSVDELSEEQINAYRILDNKLNELTTWDQGLLENELSKIDSSILNNFEDLFLIRMEEE